jgi:hypothetical protein
VRDRYGAVLDRPEVANRAVMSTRAVGVACVRADLLMVSVIVHPASHPSESWRCSFHVSDFTVCRFDFPCTGNAVAMQFTARERLVSMQVQCNYNAKEHLAATPVL